MGKTNTCCFTGQRKLPKDKIKSIMSRLACEVENLIEEGVTTFISGGALGFDQVAASLIVAKKEMGRNIRLVFVLPCKNQDKSWSTEQKKLYRNLLAEADELYYISEEYHADCIKERNCHMVDHSAYCICAALYPLTGADQTILYAKQQGIKVINVAES